MPVQYLAMFYKVLPMFVCIKLSVFAFLKIYKITWRYFCLYDFVRISIAQIISLFLLTLLISPLLFSFFGFSVPPYLPSNISVKGFPKSVLFIDTIISLLFFLGLRASKRLFLENIHSRKNSGNGKKTIIIGAGNTGDMVIRDIKKQGYKDYIPVGLLDDDINKIGRHIHGLKVYGATDMLHHVITEYGIKAIIIAIPSLNYKTIRSIYDSTKKLEIEEVKIVPRIYDIHKTHINTKNLEDIRIEDLLGRQTVDIDYKEIASFLRGKRILITGAGGSIGSEITMQVCSFQPEKVILFDIDETELHSMKIRLEKMFPNLFSRQRSNSQINNKVVFVTGDIRDDYTIDRVFRVFNPHIVFHAAAYKQVPMMEINSKEAMKVNIFGTYKVAKASANYHVEKFILISTDKVVKPASIMGVTKRMAEYICTAFGVSSCTSFLSVRFGNVLGSRGSVLPMFLGQLKHNGPLTVTHKEMERFFMTIPEAVSLVLQSSVIGNSGEILVLDMGKPVKILTLAEDLIRIHGLQPYKDIDIEFIGLRPGEKLFEEILTAEEGTTATKHKKIFVAKNSEKYTKGEIERMLKGFEKLLKVLPVKEDYEIIRDTLKYYIKSFERRRSARVNQQSEDTTNTALCKAGEATFHMYRLQFEKLLDDLPVIEDYGLIHNTINNYVESIEIRRQKIAEQTKVICHQIDKTEKNQKAFCHGS
jgi:FlaA1/EpsC-like NDP-sugar epimerase